MTSLREWFSLRARARIHKKFLSLMHPDNKCQIIDLGATPDMILMDSNYLEKNYKYPQNITVVSIEDCSNLVDEYGLKGFSFNESGKPLPFSNDEFDIFRGFGAQQKMYFRIYKSFNKEMNQNDVNSWVKNAEIF